MPISGKEGKEHAAYGEYLQSLRKYSDEIKQKVTAISNTFKAEIKQEVAENNNTLKSDINDYRSSKFIIGAPVIGEECDSSCGEQNYTENVIKLCIYNINGNSNEVKLVPGEISVSEGTLEDLDLSAENLQKITGMMDELRKREWSNGIEIKIPIYIININNILSNGNKNEVTVK